MHNRKKNLHPMKDAKNSFRRYVMMQKKIAEGIARTTQQNNKKSIVPPA